MIDKQITVRELRDKIGRTSVIHLGSLNSTHPPMNPNSHQIRVRAVFNDLCRKHWEDAKPEAYCAVAGNNTDSNIIEICEMLTQIMRKESLHFGYALRRHNAKYKNEDASEMILTQHVLEDWASMRYGYDLSLERSAAVVHLQGAVIALTILHKWLTYLKERRLCLAAYNHIWAEFGELKQSIDLRGDMWEIGGYQVMMADQGNFVAVEMRNRMFSCINDYTTTTSSSQMGQGSTDVQHIAAWDVPLEPGDSRWPPAELISARFGIRNRSR